MAAPNKPLRTYSGMVIGLAIAALIVAAIAFVVTRNRPEAPAGAVTETTETVPGQTGADSDEGPASAPVPNPAAGNGDAPTAGGAPDNKTSGAPTSGAQ